MNKIKKLLSKLGILIFSFLLIACASEKEQSADKSKTSDVVSPKQKTNVEQKIAEDGALVTQANKSTSSEQKIAKQEIIEAQVSDSVSANSNKQKIAGNGDAEFERGETYYKKNKFGRPKDPETARYYYEKAAKLGHGMAQYRLGYMYYYGQGGVEDDEKARYWWKKAIDWHEKTADLGDAKVQFRIGEIYRNSREYEKSKRRYWWEKAVYWYEKAAEQGHVEAQYQLGEAHSWGSWSSYSWWLEGISEEEEGEKARYWYEKAAEQGHVYAQRFLGWMYYFGNNIPKDLEKACYWLEKVNRQALLCDH